MQCHGDSWAGLPQGKAPTQTAVTRTHPWLSLGLDHPSPTEVCGCLLASVRSELLTVKRGAIPLPPFCPLLPILSAQWSLSPTGTRALPGLLHLAVAQGLISCSVILSSSFSTLIILSESQCFPDLWMRKPLKLAIGITQVSTGAGE